MLNAQRSTPNVQLGLEFRFQAVLFLPTQPRNADSKHADSCGKLRAHFRWNAGGPAGLGIDRTPQRPSF